MVIGFIGLGEMGKAMAANLIKNGFHVAVCDVREETIIELTALGAVGAHSPKGVAERTDVVIVMVLDSLQVDSVLFGQSGLWQGIKNGSVLIISSTVSPKYCQKIEQKAKEKGVLVLDAAVSGSRIGAEEGTLAFMVGGGKAVFDSCYPIFQAMGKKIFHIGDVGMGEAMKLVNNMIAITTVAGTSQAISVGLKSGIELEKILEVLKESSVASWVIDHWILLAQHYRERLGSRFYYKDIKLGIELANSVGEFVPIAALASQMAVSSLCPTSKTTSIKEDQDGTF